MLFAYIGFGCRVLLALVFLAAAASKLRGRRGFIEFRAAVSAFGVKPRWSSAAAGAVIACELAAAALMPADVTAPMGLGIGIALLIVFSLVIGSALRRGLSTSCRCFGTSTRPLGARHLVRNAILLTVAGAGLAATVLTGHMGSAGLDTAALFVSGFAAVVAAALVIAYDDLVALALLR
ncbi:methylamine utilization protein MauE [Nonomuraea mesophila]|uniref:Methylamine utilization protein MauE n=1 Tax=Nonomuraea mesophila TaxID=2530382 RepID=A0A4R5FDS8_9ACTN|nr:MauE/DoxX family redox-associated membrane protein [Nonomuraea mesophila]TDE47930.1 methylamine utilization protein MauE [Nonomuraea mesophila]